MRAEADGASPLPQAGMHDEHARKRGLVSKRSDDLNDLLGSLFGFPMPGHTQGQGGAIPADATVVGEGGAAGSSGTGGPGGTDGSGPQGAGGEKRPGIMETIATWSRRAFIALGIVAVIALAVCYWWFHPAINLHSSQVWQWIILIALLVIAALWVASIRFEAKRTLLHRLTAVPGLVIVAFVVGIVAGMPIIPGNAQRYATILETADGDFATDIQEVDYSEVPIIDRDSAILLGARAMGTIPEYVSQFEISTAYSQISYQGRPVRVSPLVYADLFKWFTNRSEGIPAYVLVDMTTQEAQVVRLEEPIKYSESEPLARNIDRYVQLKYPTYMFDEKSFELDEEGTPWWVFPVQKRTIGLFDGTTIQRVVLVNACTGETQDYAIEDCPDWVDRAYPSDLLIQQYNWSGMYSGGWLNSWLGQRDVVRTTQGTNGSLGYNYITQDGDLYLYTGVSSVTADNSIIGFILVNQRTGASTFYSVAGATEDSAMSSAEGAVQNLRYQATFPLLLNIEGQPTYFMALKDAAGLVKMYAMINIQQYQNVATGDTVEECQANYIEMLATNGMLGEEKAEQIISDTQVSGTIATMAQGVIEGNSHFYVTLEGDETIYDFALPGMLRIVTYQPGDEIAFTYVESDQAYTATGFVGDEVGTAQDGEVGGASDASASAGADEAAGTVA